MAGGYTLLKVWSRREKQQDRGCPPSSSLGDYWKVIQGISYQLGFCDIRGFSLWTRPYLVLSLIIKDWMCPHAFKRLSHFARYSFVCLRTVFLTAPEKPRAWCWAKVYQAARMPQPCPCGLQEPHRPQHPVSLETPVSSAWDTEDAPT